MTDVLIELLNVHSNTWNHLNFVDFCYIELLEIELFWSF